MLDVCGKNQALGHDIGCSSCKTVAASSIGAKADEYNLIIAVNAFHGYAHNRPCQLENHPLYLDGFGIEDLETCEQIFSSSNSAASLIRHASYFHWVQFLDLHFDQWDEDKYLELSAFFLSKCLFLLTENLGRFLHNNYIQALCMINDFTPLLDDFKLRQSVTDEDFVQWKHEESKFLANLAHEPPADVFAATYVEELEKLQSIEFVFSINLLVFLLMCYLIPGHGMAALQVSLSLCTPQQTSQHHLASMRQHGNILRPQKPSGPQHYDDFNCK